MATVEACARCRSKHQIGYWRDSRDAGRRYRRSNVGGARAARSARCWVPWQVGWQVPPSRGGNPSVATEITVKFDDGR